MKLSSLPKTWLFDVDGTLVKHNGHIIDGNDSLLIGVKEFFNKISDKDSVILLTSRKKNEICKLKDFLDKSGIRYDLIIDSLPYGERIIVNDMKPSGLITAYAVNKIRDASLDIDFIIDMNL